MKRLLGLLCAVACLYAGAARAQTVAKPFDAWDVTVTQRLGEADLTGWIKLTLGGLDVGYINLVPPGGLHRDPRLGEGDRYISLSVPIDRLDTLLHLFETQPALQLRFDNGSAYVESVSGAGRAPKIEIAPMRALPTGAHWPFALANWNIQTLAIPGEKVFENTKPEDIRVAADFDRLQLVRDAVNADIYALQEISSLKALAMVFPTTEWELCFSGQYDADAAGLAPDYAPDDLTDIAPTCVTDADDPALPDPAPGELRKQYLAFAVRKGSVVSIDTVADLPELSVPAEDKDGDGVIVRGVRWGFEALLNTPQGQLRVLNVHLKSGCFDGFLRDAWWLHGQVWVPDGERDLACETLARQLPTLRTWIADAKASEIPFVIIGDFNRRIDVEDEDTKAPDLLPVLNGAATPSDTTDDSALSYIPEGELSVKSCWPEDEQTELADSIEFMLFGPGDLPADWELHYKKLRYVDIAAIDGSTLKQKPDSPHLSDHCPSFVSFE